MKRSDPESKRAGQGGGLIWLQDFVLQGQPFAEVRSNEAARQNVEMTVSGLADGIYRIQPYNTWQGEHLDEFSVECAADGGRTS